MSTDIETTRILRDSNPEMSVLVYLGGVPGTPMTAETFLTEYDARIEAAREEGARIMLDKMGDILYKMAAAGEFDEKPGEPENYAKGVLFGAKTQLEVARGALDEGLVDFSHKTS